MALPKLESLNKDEKKKTKRQPLPSLDLGLPPLDPPEEEIEDVQDEFVAVNDYDDYDDFEDETYDEGEDDYHPDYEEEYEEEYIDTKRKKIIPFGGKKSKRKVKVSEFDARKNSLTGARIVRSIVMLIIVGLFAMGVKNTFFPSHVFTGEEIKAFARQGAGLTKFPKERGQAFAENFLNVYLTIDDEHPEYNDMLSHFYSASSTHMSLDQAKIEYGRKTKQNIIIPPTTFEVTMTTDHSALYKVSAYVSSTTGEVADGSTSSGRWLSFAINVYYNEENDTLAITNDSPSVIPTYEIRNQLEVPSPAPLGNGVVNTDILPALTPTIHGYIEAYAKSSVDSHESIVQYIKHKNDPSLYTGFGGSVELAGSPEDAIQKAVYNTDDEEYKVDLIVNWKDALSNGEDEVRYQSKYVMTIVPAGEGKYLVSSFKPFLYYTNDNN